MVYGDSGTGYSGSDTCSWWHFLATLIILTRAAGKYGGSWIGATISHAMDSVRKYLGFALLPQVGVTIGMVIVASQ
jgi:hypothetical protein